MVKAWNFPLTIQAHTKSFLMKVDVQEIDDAKAEFGPAPFLLLFLPITISTFEQSSGLSLASAYCTIEARILPAVGA